MRSLHPWPIFPSNLDPPVARSLSIQFILQEILNAFDLLKYYRLYTPLQLQGANLGEELVCMVKELEKFLLFSLENPFSQKGSVLDKLCFYCSILLQASNVDDKNEVPTILDEMRDHILKMKSKLLAWKKAPASLSEIQQNLSALFVRLFQNLGSFFDIFTLYLKEARSDENVLIYLIENKDTFNLFLGERRIEELLQSFFPAGHAQLRAAIIEGFTRRGFTTFLSTVEPLIDAIEWETPCLQPMS
jgi:hypothetical protein